MFQNKGNQIQFFQSLREFTGLLLFCITLEIFHISGWFAYRKYFSFKYIFGIPQTAHFFFFFFFLLILGREGDYIVASSII